jgi:hypothetical protein
MTCYKDKTFCASPKCRNQCGRKITDEQQREAQRLGLLISWSYFCGTPARGFYTNDFRNNNEPTRKI